MSKSDPEAKLGRNPIYSGLVLAGQIRADVELTDEHIKALLADPQATILASTAEAALGRGKFTTAQRRGARMEAMDLWNERVNVLINEHGPAIGMACTVVWVTDRKAATVTGVSPSGHRVTVQIDKSTRTDTNGMSEVQSYRFERDPEGHEFAFHRQADGSYKVAGKRLSLGVRSTYHDYSF